VLEWRLLLKCVVLADELDLEARLGGGLFHLATRLMTNRHGPERIVKELDVALAQGSDDGPAMANLRQRAGVDDTVEVGERAGDPVLVALDDGTDGILNPVRPSGGLSEVPTQCHL
jgi:hypothetical protein